jgi:hypothetical protein
MRHRERSTETASNRDGKCGAHLENCKSSSVVTKMRQTPRSLRPTRSGARRKPFLSSPPFIHVPSPRPASATTSPVCGIESTAFIGDENEKDYENDDSRVVPCAAGKSPLEPEQCGPDRKTRFAPDRKKQARRSAGFQPASRGKARQDACATFHLFPNSRSVGPHLHAIARSASAGGPALLLQPNSDSFIEWNLTSIASFRLERVAHAQLRPPSLQRF